MKSRKKRPRDEFSDLPISRQSRYRARQRRDGRCIECGAPAGKASRCLRHLTLARERERKRLGLKRRYFGSMGYRMESANQTFQ